MQQKRIGIDPDLKKSGFAMIDVIPFVAPEVSVVDTMDFFELIEVLNVQKKYCLDKGIKYIVFIEAGWLNKKSNYHVAFNKEIAGRIGKNVGENHAVGKLLEEYCIREKIDYKLVRPTTKKWDAELFKKITKYDKRTNSEMRDAVRAAWL